MIIFDYNALHTTSHMNRDGQITIPVAVREKLGIAPGAKVELFYAGENAYVLRFDASRKCKICGSETNIIKIKGKAICEKCLSAAEMNVKEKEECNF